MKSQWRQNWVAVKEWWQDLFKVPYDIVDLTLIAQIWMLSDPTISVYTFDNGVEDRHATSPYRRIDESLDRFEQVVQAALERKAEAFKQAQ